MTTTPGTLAEAEIVTLLPRIGSPYHENMTAALADLRALMARCEHLEAEEVGLTKERNVVRDACEALAAMRDRADADNARLRASLADCECSLSLAVAHGLGDSVAVDGDARTVLELMRDDADAARAALAEGGAR